MVFRNPVRNRGFTLIELLVVVAIIAVLMALLLPAVQKVREAANRINCGSNMNQLAMGCHMFHQDYNTFPRNYNDNNYSAGGRGWSWLSRVLPYIEQGPLFTAYGLAYYPTLNSVPAAVATHVPVFRCPSDTAITTSTNRANIGASLTVGLTNYKGVAGANWAWGSYPNAGTGGKGTNGLDDGDGMFFRCDTAPNTIIGYPFPSGYPRKLRIEDVRDGTSGTFMIGEDIPEMNVHCSWPFFNHATGTCAVPLNNAQMPGQPGYNNPGDWPNVYSFRSRHPSGANFAMADRSIRFVRDSINITVYRGLATIRGNEVVQLED